MGNACVHYEQVDALDNQDDEGHSNEHSDDSADASTREYMAVTSQAAAQEAFEGEGTINGQSSRDQLEFRTLLDYEIASEYMLGYIVKELPDYAMSFRCWMRIRKYYDLPKNFDRFETAQSIYDTFICDNSHVDSQLKKRIENVLINGEGCNPEVLVRIFDLVYVKLFLMLYREVYVHFAKCPEYPELMMLVKAKVNNFQPKDFDIYDVLGKGGFGLVCEARKKSTGVRYAMKIQGKQGVFEMFGDEPWRACLEMRAFASCKHPYIVELWCAFQTESLLFLVMTLGTWCDLSQLLRYGGPQPYAHVLFYSAEITSALSYLHSKHFLYRDLKPANVLLNLDGHIQLVDFGAVCDLNGKVLEKCHDRKQTLFADETIRESCGGALPAAQDIEFGTTTGTGTGTGSGCDDIGSASSKRSEKAAVVPAATTHLNIDSQSEAESQHSTNINNNPTNSSSPKRAKSLVGTYGYMAPEMAVMLGEESRINSGFDEDRLNRGYTHAVDWWSLGVLVYKMLVGRYPFQCGQDKNALPTWEILNAPVDYSMSIMSKNPHAKTFISGLLTVDDTKRLGSDPEGSSAVRQHPFYVNIDWKQLEMKLVPPPSLPKVTIPTNPNKRTKKYDSLMQLLCLTDRENWIDFGGNPDDDALQHHFASWDYASPNMIAAEIDVTKSRTRSKLENSFSPVKSSPLVSLVTIAD